MSTTTYKTKWTRSTVDGRYSAHNAADILDGNYISAWALKDGYGWTIRFCAGSAAQACKTVYLSTLGECKKLAEAIFAEFDAWTEMRRDVARFALDNMFHKVWMAVFA